MIGFCNRDGECLLLGTARNFNSVSRKQKVVSSSLSNLRWYFLRPLCDSLLYNSLYCTLTLRKYLNMIKAVPLQARGGPEGSRKLRFPDFVTTAQNGGKVVSLTHRPPLPPGNTPGTHFYSRLSRPQGHSAIGRILCQWKIDWHQLGSNQQPSDL